MEHGNPFELFIFLLIFIVICVAVNFISKTYHRYKEGGGNFLENETLFDKKYFEIRKKHLTQDSSVYYPLNTYYSTRLKNSFLLFSTKNVNYEKDISSYFVYTVAEKCPSLYATVIFEIFAYIKDFDCLISKKFFEPQSIRINYWKDKTDNDIRTIVRNILTCIKIKGLLTVNELQQIVYLLNEIAIGGIIKNPVKYQELLNILENEKVGNPSEALLNRIILPNTKEHMKLILESISDQLQVEINFYDFNHNKDDADILVTKFSPENPLMEMSLFKKDDRLYGLRKTENLGN